ncbi:MAG: PorT family protein [Verrucomicrobia bacterium]|nr:PorT family protein [Prolixibacteraceae bacterium]
MKNKIVFLVAILTMFGFYANAQTMEDEGASFGLRGGVNFQNINGEDPSGDKWENDMAVRFNAGVVANIPVAPEFYFQPGLLYTTKGAKFNGEVLGIDTSSELNTSYLELPLSFLYRPLLGTGHILLGFGPYVAYGLGGKFESGDNELDIKFGDESSDDFFYLKRMDYGANLFFGYELQNGLSVQLNTQLGLANILPDVADNDATFKNTGFGISLGYMF